MGASILNSVVHTLALLNRDNWEIYDDKHEELQVSIFNRQPKKEKEQARKNIELRDKLVLFCINHFDEFKPEFDDYLLLLP